METARRWYDDHEEVYSAAERTVAHYHALGFLSAAARRTGDDPAARSYGERQRALRARDPGKLAAYLADPHMNYSKWPEFKAAQLPETR
jgi:hypothetical protein